MTEMYVSFSVKSSDFGYKLTHFRRDFVKSGVTTLEIACLVLMSASIILLEDLEGEREGERERFMCVFATIDGYLRR